MCQHSSIIKRFKEIHEVTYFKSETDGSYYENKDNLIESTPISCVCTTCDKELDTELK
jgi:Zn finger protein HypA/HybF involved in hydrogenase expression